MKKLKILLTTLILAMILTINFTVADLEIKSFTNIGNNPDLKLNLTLYNSGSETINFNITLIDTSNNRNNREIFSGTNSIGANETKSIIFGKYGNYDYEFNDKWENYRCGAHNVEVKISYHGGTLSKSTSFDIDADNFDVRYYIEDKEVDLKDPSTKPSLSDTIVIKVFKANGNPIENADVIIRYIDGEKEKQKTTNSKGIVSPSFKPSYDFGKDATGTYEIKIMKHSNVDGHYYCDYKKEDIIIKKKLKILSITPENPKINEKITLTISAENGEYYGTTLWVEGNNKNPIYQTLSSSTYQFLLDSPGTYTVKILKDTQSWDDSKTITVSDFPELKIHLPENIVLDQENEFIITDSNDVRISQVTVTLEDPKGQKNKQNTNYNGVVKFTLQDPGNYKITAEKENYKSASETFSALKELKISIPEEIKIYDEVKIMLLDKDNSPVDGKIYVDNVAYNTNQGYILYNFTQFKEYQIRGESLGYYKANRKIKPLKIINVAINKENFSIGEEIIINLSGEGLKNPRIEIKNLETNTSITYYGLNQSLKLYAPGNYNIVASAEGFGKTIKEIFVRNLPLKIYANYDKTKKIIFIKVTSEDKPVDNVSITIITPGNLFAYLSTDINGTAKFDKIYETGNYTIKSEKSLYLPSQTTVNVEKESNFDLTTIALVIVIIIVVLLLGFFAYYLKNKNRKGEKIPTEESRIL